MASRIRVGAIYAAVSRVCSVRGRRRVPLIALVLWGLVWAPLRWAAAAGGCLKLNRLGIGGMVRSYKG
eukprot:1188180-Prymnesium_polylepis.1